MWEEDAAVHCADWGLSTNAKRKHRTLSGRNPRASIWTLFPKRQSGLVQVLSGRRRYPYRRLWNDHPHPAHRQWLDQCGRVRAGHRRAAGREFRHSRGNSPITFSDEFDSLSVSRLGIGTRWSAHTPWNGDFGDAKFVDPHPGFPFTVEDGILAITARKDATGHWKAGLLSSTNPQGQDSPSNMVDLALGSGWPIDKTPNPSVFLVDYVRAYAPSPNSSAA